jgi:glyoxylase-like metal-dependent hydrolase (beta-lactamase superfamily II)
MAAVDWRAEAPEAPVPAPGETREIAPGVHWVRMPLPFALDHVNLWLIEDGDGWTLVDTGLANDATRETWRAILAGPAAGRPIRRLIATHFHPDHIGLAGWFEAELGVPLWATRTEFLMARAIWATPDEVAGARQTEFFRRHGLPEEAGAALSARGNPYRRRAGEPPASFTRIQDGDAIEIGGRSWRVVVGRGHAPEQACLHCPELNLLASADQVLAHITPNVSVIWSEPEADPLAEFLASAGRFRDVPEDALVLPSHGRPFAGLHARLAALEDHHASRLARVAEACAGEPRSAHDMLDVLFRRKMDEHNLPFAMGEAIAHIVHLERKGTLRREEGRDGVLRFRAG